MKRKEAFAKKNPKSPKVLADKYVERFSYGDEHETLARDWYGSIEQIRKAYEAGVKKGKRL